MSAVAFIFLGIIWVYREGGFGNLCLGVHGSELGLWFVPSWLDLNLVLANLFWFALGGLVGYCVFQVILHFQPRSWPPGTATTRAKHFWMVSTSLPQP